MVDFPVAAFGECLWHFFHVLDHAMALWAAARGVVMAFLLTEVGSLQSDPLRSDAKARPKQLNAQCVQVFSVIRVPMVLFFLPWASNDQQKSCGVLLPPKA